MGRFTDRTGKQLSKVTVQGSFDEALRDTLAALASLHTWDSAASSSSGRYCTPPCLPTRHMWSGNRRTPRGGATCCPRRGRPQTPEWDPPPCW